MRKLLSLVMLLLAGITMAQQETETLTKQTLETLIQEKITEGILNPEPLVLLNESQIILPMNLREDWVFTGTVKVMLKNSSWLISKYGTKAKNGAIVLHSVAVLDKDDDQNTIAEVSGGVLYLLDGDEIEQSDLSKIPNGTIGSIKIVKNYENIIKYTKGKPYEKVVVITSVK